jgi:hypothetical protein
MSHTDIHESGTCRAMPLRDAWGRPHRDGWWSQRQAEEITTRPTRGTFSTTPSATGFAAAAVSRSLDLIVGVTA